MGENSPLALELEKIRLRTLAEIGELPTTPATSSTKVEPTTTAWQTTKPQLIRTAPSVEASAPVPFSPKEHAPTPADDYLVPEDYTAAYDAEVAQMEQEKAE